MTKYTLALAFLLSSCSSRSVDSSLGGKKEFVENGALTIDSSLGQIEKIRVGMSLAALRSLGYDFSQSSISMEGDEYISVDIALRKDLVLTCIFDQSEQLYECSTSSSLMRDENGAGVGTTLTELKAKYPHGKLLMGDEDGRYASFTNGTKVIFSLNQRGINESCFDDPNGHCNADEKTEVSKVRVNRVAN